MIVLFVKNTISIKIDFGAFIEIVRLAKKAHTFALRLAPQKKTFCALVLLAPLKTKTMIYYLINSPI